MKKQTNSADTTKDSPLSEIQKMQKEKEALDLKMKTKSESVIKELVKERDTHLSRVKEINDTIGSISPKKPGRPKGIKNKDGVATGDNKVVPIEQVAEQPAEPVNTEAVNQ